MKSANIYRQESIIPEPVRKRFCNLHLDFFIYLFFIVSLLWNLGCHRSALPFNAKRAYDDLIAQCALGPRTPGSQVHKKTADLLAGRLRKLADLVYVQRFLHVDSKTDSSIALTNIIASFNLSQTERILLCAHWDTRRFADRDPDPAKRKLPILGANDGASGVAVLLEVARCIREKPPSSGVDIVLFDGEDYGEEGNLDEYFLGSRYFAQSKRGVYHPKFGILLDMVGDRDLDIYVEYNSEINFPSFVRNVWSTAAQLGIREFHPQTKYRVEDDHIPLIENGIPCIDIIDFDYPYWHTLSDTPDKCSPESLKKVGDVVLRVIYTG